MRIALSKSTLRVPPTYFAIDHALRMRQRHELRMFTFVAEITDPAVDLPVTEAVPFPGAGFRHREFAMPAFGHRMTRAISAWNPDLIHQHLATWSLPAVAASRRTGSPLLTTLHGVDVFVRSRQPRTPMERWHHRNIDAATAQSARVLAVSRYLADQAIAAGVPTDRLDVHYQGVDTEFFSPDDTWSDAPSAPVPDGPPLLLFVGSLVAQKGIDALLDVSNRLAATLEHRLVVIGDGPLRAELAARAESHVQLLGRLDRPAIREWMRRAHALAAPSRDIDGRREAAGLVLVEAQACGTPVIAADSGGMPEMLRPDDTGLLVPERDDDALADAVRTLLELPRTEREQMGRRAREFVVEQRSLDASVGELDAHYADLAGR